MGSASGATRERKCFLHNVLDHLLMVRFAQLQPKPEGVTRTNFCKTRFPLTMHDVLTPHREVQVQAYHRLLRPARRSTPLRDGRVASPCLAVIGPAVSRRRRTTQWLARQGCAPASSTSTPINPASYPPKRQARAYMLVAVELGVSRARLEQILPIYPNAVLCVLPPSSSW